MSCVEFPLFNWSRSHSLPKRQNKYQTCDWFYFFICLFEIMNRKFYYILHCYNPIFKHILMIKYSSNIQVYRENMAIHFHVLFPLSLFSSETTFLTSYYIFVQAFLFIFIQFMEWWMGLFLISFFQGNPRHST